jgi:hypothetical protein
MKLNPGLADTLSDWPGERGSAVAAAEGVNHGREFMGRAPRHGGSGKSHPYLFATGH